MSIKITLAVLAASVLLVALPAQAAGLPDGEYDCMVDLSGSMGNFWINGNTYQGPLYDQEGPSYPFEVTPSGTINWGGPLQGFEEDGNTVVSTVLRQISPTRSGFDVTIQTETGNFTTVGCDPQN